MISGKDIIIVGQQAWDVEIGSNCKNIALELSKYNRVLYVNSPLDRITKIRSSKDLKVKMRVEIIKNKKKGLIKIQENLWTLYPDVLIESINWIRSNKLFSYLNKINNKRFSKTIESAIRELGFSNYFLFNDSDIFRSFHLKELLNPTISVYYSRDNMIATNYWKRHGEILEPKLIQKSDLCVSNSEYLKNYCKNFNQNSFFVGQGCDFELYTKSDLLSVPKELTGIKAPIIGYVGALTSLRLNIDLIYHLAKHSSKWTIVLVGPQDEAFRRCKLHALENIIFISAQKPEELPKFINSFDVCMNPQALNDLTIGNYPRKIDEYLAMGKATVATYTETMLMFKDYVLLAKDENEFIEMVGEALELNNRDLIEKRKQFAFSHSWENSVSMISHAINNHLYNN